MNVLNDAAHDMPQDLMQPQTREFPLEATEQLAQFHQHREESTVPEVAVYTSNSCGEMETLKKLRG